MYFSFLSPTFLCLYKHIERFIPAPSHQQHIRIDLEGGGVYMKEDGCGCREGEGEGVTSASI